MSDETEAYLFLQFHVNMLKLFNLWPKPTEILTKEFKLYNVTKYSFLILILPSLIPLLYDFITIYREEYNVTLLMVTLLPIAALIGESYMVICFLQNREKVRDLVERLAIFQRYSPLPDIIETDKKAIFISKGFLAYATISSCIYSITPLFSLKQCNENKSKQMIEHNIPCTLVIRARLPDFMNSDFWYKCLYAHQIFMVFYITSIILILSMLLCGILIHVTHHLKNLRLLLIQVCEYSDEEIEKEVISCILYHIEIIEFSKDLNKSFRSQMIMHLTLTSFIISILGFIILSTELKDVPPFVAHLLAWTALLLLVCYFGQTLMDESVGVATDAYNTSWYNSPLTVQKSIKLIITRAQKPLTIEAMSLGFMGFVTFLKVYKSAYSYFTLLLNLNL